MRFGYRIPYLHRLTMVIRRINCQYQVLFQVQFVPMAVALPTDLDHGVTRLHQDVGQGHREKLTGDLPNQIDCITNLHYRCSCTWVEDSFAPNGSKPGWGQQLPHEMGFPERRCLRRSSWGLRSPDVPPEGRGGP